MGCSGSKADDNGLATAWGNGGAGGGKPRDKGRKGRHSKHRGSEDSRSASSSEESRGRRRVLGDDYTLGLTLGRGHYGWVYKGKCKRSGRQVAVKVIDRSKSRPKRLKLEVAILRRIHRHPNIVQLFDVYHTDQHVNLVLEFMSGGELFERLVDKGPFSERAAANMTRKLASALRYIHKKGIVHRDLKPENILLSDSSSHADVKLADFGLSRIVENPDDVMHTICGTWAYSAPEVRINRNPRKGYTSKVDMWSLGVILYVSLSGYHPFDPEGTAPEAVLQEAIKHGRYDFNDPVWEDVSDSAKSLIESLIVVDAEERAAADDVLLHPWVKRYTPRLHRKRGKAGLSHNTSGFGSSRSVESQSDTNGYYSTSQSMHRPTSASARNSIARRTGGGGSGSSDEGADALRSASVLSRLSASSTHTHNNVLPVAAGSGLTGSHRRRRSSRRARDRRPSDNNSTVGTPTANSHKPDTATSTSAANNAATNSTTTNGGDADGSGMLLPGVTPDTTPGASHNASAKDNGDVRPCEPVDTTAPSQEQQQQNDGNDVKPTSAKARDAARSLLAVDPVHPAVPAQGDGDSDPLAQTEPGLALSSPTADARLAHTTRRKRRSRHGNDGDATSDRDATLAQLGGGGDSVPASPRSRRSRKHRRHGSRARSRERSRSRDGGDSEGKNSKHRGHRRHRHRRRRRRSSVRSRASLMRHHKKRDGSGETNVTASTAGTRSTVHSKASAAVRAAIINALVEEHAGTQSSFEGDDDLHADAVAAAAARAAKAAGQAGQAEGQDAVAAVASQAVAAAEEAAQAKPRVSLAGLTPEEVTAQREARRKAAEEAKEKAKAAAAEARERLRSSMMKAAATGGEEGGDGGRGAGTAGGKSRGPRTSTTSAAAVARSRALKVMDMGSGEVIEGADFAIIEVDRAPSPGPRRPRRMQSKRGRGSRRSGGSKSPRSNRGKGRGSHRSGSRRRGGNGMAYDDDPSGPRVRLAREVGDLVLGAGRRGPGAMVSAVDALKSGEVEEEEQEDATFLDAEQRRRARERRANGQQEGAMAELNEGEVLTEDIDKYKASDELPAPRAPLEGAMAGMESGEEVAEACNEDVDADLLNDPYALGPGASNLEDYGYMAAMESGEAIAEDLGAGFDEAEAPAPAPTGFMAAMESGEELSEEVEVMDPLAANMYSRAGHGSGKHQHNGHSTKLLQGMESGEIVGEDRAACGLDIVDPTLIPHAYSRAQHPSSKALTARNATSMRRALDRMASGEVAAGGLVGRRA